MKKVTIVGAAGYVGRELISLLMFHPKVQIGQLISKSQEGKKVSLTHSLFACDDSLYFEALFIPEKCDVLFLCGPYGSSIEFLLNNEVLNDTLIIDLTIDNRTNDLYTYGLVEMHKGKVSNKIANPGCFATVIQLSILPTLNMVHNVWHINAITGSSGAGQNLQKSSHFSWRANNISSYKIFEHQHLIEMNYNLDKMIKSDTNVDKLKLNFIPNRGDFVRGIYSTAYCETSLKGSAAKELFKDFYSKSYFTKIVDDPIDLKQVIGTNFCLINPQVIDDKLVVVAVIDNLIKGAAGQAIENMNCFFGFPIELGLQLKSSVI